MIELDTDRLKIIPLTLDELGLLLDGIEKLEQSMNLAPCNVTLDEHTAAAMKELYDKAANDRPNHLWHTCWQIVLKSRNMAVGSACFKNSPDADGAVEIGYGIDEQFRGNGYMTEAASAMIQWAISRPDVKTVIAETEKDNPASHRVLQKCGMTIYKETPDAYWWKYSAVLSPSR